MQWLTRILAALVLLPASAAGAGSAHAASGTGHKVLVFIEENHTEGQALAQMPYLASMGRDYGKATDYKAITHPSLPNYLAIAGGSTFGVTDDSGPSEHPIAGKSVFDQAIAAGRTARIYAESMPSNCYRADHAPYSVRHNPWTYFTDSGPRANCAANDVPSGSPTSGRLRSDILAGNLPATGLMVPNLCDDAHNSGCSLARADAYLKSWMQLIKSGPDWTSGRLTVIVTFDEDDRSADNTVAFVVADPRLHGKTVTIAANHYSLTRWLDINAGAAPLNKAVTAAGLKTAFGL
jgi:acid phosphatase